MMTVNNTLAEAIETLKAETGLSFAQMGIRSGLNPSAIWYLSKGKSADPETVIKIARAFNQDVAEWMRLAGHETIEKPHTETPSQFLGRRLVEVTATLDYAGDITLRKWKGRGSLTWEDANRIVGEVEDDIKAEQAELELRKRYRK